MNANAKSSGSPAKDCLPPTIATQLNLSHGTVRNYLSEGDRPN